MLFAMVGEIFSTFDTQKGGSSESPFSVIRLGKLQAKLCRSVTLPASSFSFRITDVQGKTFLLGTTVATHPFVAIDAKVADNPGNEAKYTFTLQENLPLDC